MIHWAQQYVGLPWTPLGHGPAEFNCWGLAWHVQRYHFERQIPRYDQIPGDAHAAVQREIVKALATGEWVPLDEPQDGCMVGLSSARSVHHVGVFLDVDRGLVLHACEGKGVLAQPLSTLRLNGWGKILFYRHTSWPS